MNSLEAHVTVDWTRHTGIEIYLTMGGYSIQEDANRKSTSSGL